MFKALRELDRNLNLEHYPKLFFNEVYLLEGGYKDMFAQHPECCEGGYTPMERQDLVDVCKRKYSKHRSLFKEYSVKEAVTRLS